MGDSVAENVRLIDKPWLEIRRSFQSQPYALFYEQFASGLPEIGRGLDLVPTPETTQAIEGQISRATPEQLLYRLNVTNSQPKESDGVHGYRAVDQYGNNFTVKRVEGYKLFVLGRNEPELGNGENLTRLYVALDPRKATDAFLTLVQELSSKRVLDSIQLCLNLEETGEPKISANSVVIYIANSDLKDRQLLIDKIVDAYKSAKVSHPEFFAIEKAKEKELLAYFFSSYRLFLDQNLSFVEMPNGSSYDGDGQNKIDSALRVERDSSHLTRLNALKRNAGRVLWSDRSLKLGLDLKDVPLETIYDSVRSLSVPALVQRSQYKIIDKSGQRSLQRVN